jgi:hypothetical protein
MEGAIRRHSIWVAAALLVALAMRLFALALAGDAIHYGDPRNYVRLATALAEGRGMVLPNAAGDWVPTGMFPPGLPLLLAAVALVLPLNTTVICLVNTLIDASAALLLGRLATQLGRRDLSVPLALAYLLWPSIAFMAPLAYKEGLIIALLLAALVALLEQAGRPGFRWAALSGLAAGALILTQPGLAPLVPMMFLLFAKRFGSMSRWLAVSACAAGVALLLMVPWWIRNAMIFGQFVPLTTSAGLALWVGADPGGGMVWKAPLAEWAKAGEVEAARLAAAEAWRTIAADPFGYVMRCLAKLPRSFFTTNWAIDQLILAPDAPRPDLAQSIRLRAVPTLAELSVVLAALAGLFRFRKSAAAMLLLACIAQVMVFSIWFEFSERHRLFMTPFFLLLAGMLLAGREDRPGVPAE